MVTMSPTRNSTPMRSDASRRRFLLLAGAGALGLALRPGRAWALTNDEASRLISRLVAEVNGIINSGKPESAMFSDFEQVLWRYGDLPIIARATLGVPWRSISDQQRRAFTQSYAIYLSRKYGRRFSQFRGAQIRVTDTRPVNSFFEVSSVADVPGEGRYNVRWHVSDRGGSTKMFNIFVEGVNLIATERAEIGAMLDQRGGDVDRLIRDLRSAG